MLSWRDAYPMVETSTTVMVNAMDLASDHGLEYGNSEKRSGIARPRAISVMLNGY